MLSKLPPPIGGLLSFNGVKLYKNASGYYSKVAQMSLDIVSKYIRMFPHKSRNYVEIGAGYGTQMIPVSKLFQKTYAYEPNNAIFPKLVENVASSSCLSIECYNLGIHEKQEFGRIDGATQRFSIDRNGDVLFKPLDQECLDKDIECVDFLHCDVNGGEWFVLKSAEKMIRKWKPLIQFQSSQISVHAYAIFPMSCISFLTSLGYRGFDNSDPDRYAMYCPNDTHSVIPRTIYTFWTGHNEMSQNRRNCLDQLPLVTEANVLLIDVNNYRDYILQIEPLHPAFEYLSETHKADYLRTYFMHFYGGGYTDIKYTTGSWKNSFDEMSNTSDKVICGYKEIGPHGVPVMELREHWEDLIGGGCYICKPNSIFTQNWYSRMVEILDKKLDLLKANPSRYPQDCSEDGQGYPLAWQEILGRIFHRVCYEERASISQSLPILLFHSYR